MSRRTETAYKAGVSASQHHMTKSHGFRRNGKCCGCVATVHVLIRGDLLRRLAAQHGMTNKWLKDQGLVSVKELWVKTHYPATAR